MPPRICLADFCQAHVTAFGQTHALREVMGEGSNCAVAISRVAGNSSDVDEYTNDGARTFLEMISEGA